MSARHPIAPSLPQQLTICTTAHFLGICLVMRYLQALMVLWRTIEDHDTLFVLAEVAHFVGIGLLAYKMYSKRSAAGGQLVTVCCIY